MEKNSFRLVELMSDLHLKLGASLSSDERKGRNLSGKQMYLLSALTCGMSVGDICQLFPRVTQGGVSQMITGLQKKGLVSKARDDANQRRMLVWLTSKGVRIVQAQREHRTKLISQAVKKAKLGPMNKVRAENLLRTFIDSI